MVKTVLKRLEISLKMIFCDRDGGMKGEMEREKEGREGMEGTVFYAVCCAIWGFSHMPLFADVCLSCVLEDADKGIPLVPLRRW